MQKIRVPITRAESTPNSAPRTKRLQFAGILLLAAVFGFAFGRSPNLSFITPSGDPRLLLGAVGSDVTSSATPQTAGIEVAEIAADAETERSATEDASEEIVSPAAIAPQETPARSREELEILIEESQTKISRRSEEITRIRNASVTLVGEFDTNCGDWEDDCARYYVIALEQNNSAYNDLVQKIEEEERILENLQNELLRAE